jgi:hypothetical protein
MTVALSIKVHDGLVLASDSAATIYASDQDGNLATVNVYNNANKVFNLRRGLPIGGMVWGAGSIGRASIATLAKDLRLRLEGQERGAFRGWKVSFFSSTPKSAWQTSRLSQRLGSWLGLPENQNGSPKVRRA